MLRTLTFLDDYRTFHKGDTVTFRPGVNVLVGLNGCGKSTLLQLLANADKYKDTVRIDSDPLSVIHFDSERDNHRTLSQIYGDGMFQMQSHFISHGEYTWTILNKLLAEFESVTAGLLLLDEPDTAMSMRAASSLGKFLARATPQSQIIVTAHHPFIIECIPFVLDVSRLQWITGQDFIAEMRGDGPVFAPDPQKKVRKRKKPKIKPETKPWEQWRPRRDV
jgi:predicted ATPase